MTLKYKIIIGIIALGVTFGLGRFSATKTVETKTTKVEQTEKNEHLRKKTTTIKQKDGTIKTVTVVDKDTRTKKNVNLTSEIKTKTAKPSTTVSVLFAYDFTNKEKLSGISLQQSLGPISIGVFGLSGNNEKIGGVSAGWGF